jgi:uncharacterized protein YjbI with pentapeptide repeats
MLLSLVNAGLDTLTYDKIFAKADFWYADLRGANLRGKYLNRAKLHWADLSDAVLDSADLNQAILFNANLRKAYLREADLRWAYLRKADLRWADLRWTNLRWVDLREAFLDSAKVSSLEAFKEIGSFPTDFPTDKYEIDATPQEEYFLGNFYYVRRKKK